MTEEMTYEELAGHYDRIYHDKPYEREAQTVVDLLRKEGAREGQRLLDVGCGTGQHVQYFVETFDVTGVDLHEPVLDIARGRVPEARFLAGDITTLDLGETFDALTCLFGVVGYVETWDNLDRAIGNVADHLEPGAPFVIESWIPADRFPELESQPTIRTYEGEEVTLARIAIPHGESEEVAELEIEWMIARPGEGIERYSETQHMGLFDVDRTLELFDEHGIDARVSDHSLTDQRVLFVGRRRV